MPDKKGKGLLMGWQDMPADKEEEFNRWYNQEHIGEVLACPGVLSAARYVTLRGSPKYHITYELESPRVTESAEYQWHRRPENRTEWYRSISHTYHATTFIANVYEQVFPSEVSQDVVQSDMAPVLQIGRMDVPPEFEDEFNEWYNTIYMPNFEKVPGCIRGRRYRLFKDVAEMGQPKYATVYELEHEGVPQSPEWAAAREAHPLTPRMRGLMQHAPGSPGVYKKIFQPQDLGD